MHKQLKTHYYFAVVPAVGLFLAIGLAKTAHLIHTGQFAVPSFVHSMVFVLSAATAIAGPLFVRTMFAHFKRLEHQVSEHDFLAFQRRLLWVSQVTPYLAVTAFLCDFPKFYATAIVLMALYAVYYYFPSQRRIDFDRKIFRVR